MGEGNSLRLLKITRITVRLLKITRDICHCLINKATTNPSRVLGGRRVAAWQGSSGGSRIAAVEAT